MDRLCMENCSIPKDIIAIEQAGTSMGLTMIQTFYSLPQVRTEKVNSQPAKHASVSQLNRTKTSNHSNNRKKKEQTPPVYASPPGILLPKDIPPICTESKFRA